MTKKLFINVLEAYKDYQQYEDKLAQLGINI